MRVEIRVDVRKRSQSHRDIGNFRIESGQVFDPDEFSKRRIFHGFSSYKFIPPFCLVHDNNSTIDFDFDFELKTCILLYVLYYALTGQKEKLGIVFFSSSSSSQERNKRRERAKERRV